MSAKGLKNKLDRIHLKAVLTEKGVKILSADHNTKYYRDRWFLTEEPLSFCLFQCVFLPLDSPLVR